MRWVMVAGLRGTVGPIFDIRRSVAKVSLSPMQTSAISPLISTLLYPPCLIRYFGILRNLISGLRTPSANPRPAISHLRLAAILAPGDEKLLV
jgi:hypothetical protein